MTKTTRKPRTKKTAPPGTITVSTRVIARSDGEESEIIITDDYEEVEVQKFETDPAFVEAKAGVTKSLRQFESLRVDVRMCLPCYMEKADDTFDYAADWVANRLYEEIDKYFEGADDGEG